MRGSVCELPGEIQPGTISFPTNLRPSNIFLTEIRDEKCCARWCGMRIRHFAMTRKSLLLREKSPWYDYVNDGTFSNNCHLSVFYWAVIDFLFELLSNCSFSVGGCNQEVNRDSIFHIIQMAANFPLMGLSSRDK